MSDSESAVPPSLSASAHGQDRTKPTVSVIVPTRNRPLDLARFLRSAEEFPEVSYEIVVADQSDGDESEMLCGNSPLASRIRYVKCAPNGKSHGVNCAAKVARGDILAFTDDDCTPDRNWLRNAIATFDARPHLSLLFGEFRPIDHDPAQAYVPGYHITNPREYGRIPSASWQSGVGGNLVARAKAFWSVGGLDERLGPGALFTNADDYDLSHRLVSAGYIAADAPTVIVTHWGIRSFSDGTGQRLLRNCYFGGGAMFAKRVKCGDLAGIAALWQQTTILLRESGRAAIHTRRPSGLGRLIMMYWGFVRAIPVPVDRNMRVFRPEPSVPSTPGAVPHQLGSQEEWV